MSGSEAWAFVEPDDEDGWDDIARMVVLVVFLVFFGVFANRYR